MQVDPDYPQTRPTIIQLPRQPKVGFLRAFSLGADFINVGMFDWQVRDDAQVAKDILTRKLERERAWFS